MREGPTLSLPWQWLGEGGRGCLVPRGDPGARATVSTGQEGLLRAEGGRDFWRLAEGWRRSLGWKSQGKHPIQGLPAL